MKYLNIIKNGIFNENPTFVQVIGMCPTLAVTTGAVNGVGMGLTTTFVLACSNLVISLIRNIIPDKVRIPAFIVVIASFVTIIQLLLEAYMQELNDSLGIFIPLIVVNCIILARAEAYASKNGPVASLFDGIGQGLGFTCALTILGIIREFIGAGAFFGTRILPEAFPTVNIMILPPGAFITLGLIMALLNYMKGRKKTA
jgi:electron transport complex protein RnfE